MDNYMNRNIGYGCTHWLTELRREIELHLLWDLGAFNFGEGEE